MTRWESFGLLMVASTCASLLVKAAQAPPWVGGVLCLALGLFWPLRVKR